MSRLILVILILANMLRGARADFPNDPLYPANQYDLQIMNVPAAWQYSLGSPNVTIAVLDTGIVFNTPELQGRFLTPINALNPTSPETSSTQNHGTWVASEIAMPIDNGVGGAGTGNFSVLPIRVTDANANTTDAWIEQGITLAAQSGCRVMTISLSASSYPAINAAVTQALAANAAAGRPDFLVFMAAGNGNTFKTLGSPDLDNAALRLPSDNLIMVGGTDENDQRWATDTFVGSDIGPFLDISAPAHNILVEDGTNTPNYGLGSGTSFASPLAASAAALAFSINPNLTADQVKNMLFDTAFNPDNPNPGTPFWDQTFGWGRVDFGALAVAANASLTAVPVPEPASLGLLAFGAVMMLARRRKAA